jgi:hypothetical protein
MSRINVQSRLSPKVYEQLQAYMTDHKLSEAAAIEAILSGYFDNPQDDLMKRFAKMEQALSDMNSHLLAIRFRNI